MDGYEFIVSKYSKMESFRHPLTGEPFTKSEKIEAMYTIVNGDNYDIKFSDEQKILASKLITKILEDGK